MKIILTLLIVIFAFSLPLGACGIKPDTLNAPNETVEDNFPRTYPNPKR